MKFEAIIITADAETPLEITADSRALAVEKIWQQYGIGTHIKTITPTPDDADAMEAEVELP